MRVIIVEDKVAGGKEACKVFANALANGAKVLVWQLVELRRQPTKN